MREEPGEIGEAQGLVQEAEEGIGRVDVRDEREASEARHPEEVVRVPKRVDVALLERPVRNAMNFSPLEPHQGGLQPPS